VEISCFPSEKALVVEVLSAAFLPQSMRISHVISTALHKQKSPAVPGLRRRYCTAELVREHELSGRLAAGPLIGHEIE
jgi:hypothetical protein